ncbi:MAG: hypothetical protein NZ519_12955 [Bacteroidia bacterium]|nr:hypothetical protein [Bacteroidia bacterium]MDW8302843.1 hypothetical protein [Bacteroidia bacterium]
MKAIKVLTLLLLVAVSAVTFTSCKKYEEGPAISLRSKKARVVGKWKVEKAMENGNDVTSIVNMLSPIYEYKKNGDLVLTMSFLGVTQTETHKWEFDDDKESIIITYTNTTPNEKEEWKILRLKNKEMWLKHTHDGDTVELHLEADE